MKNKDSKIRYTICLIVSVIVVLIASLWQGKGLAVIISNVCGIVFFFLIACHQKEAYFLGILQALMIGVTLIMQQNISSSLYHLLFCISMYIFGYLLWRKEESSKEFSVKTLDKKTKVIGMAIITVIIGMYVTVVYLLGGSFAIFDSVAFVFGFISVFLIANRYLEAWFSYIILYGSNFIMWGILSIQNIQNLPMLLLTGVYLMIALYALIKWRKIKIKGV